MTRTRALGAVVVLTLVASALVISASAAAAEPAGSPAAGTASEFVEPQLALQRALALFAPARVSARYSSAVAGADPRDATMVLRDLAAQRWALDASDRRLAARLLARPTDGPRFEGPAGYNAAARASKKRFCNTRFCVHWVTKSDERPSLKDREPRNGRPDYVDKTIANMNTTWATEIGRLGYKKPLSDRRSGKHRGGNPNGKIDIFIANIGDFGLYGYCTTDDWRAHPLSHRQNSAYCVIDDDFSPWEFQSGATRNAANKVTLAHEFFHAVQFAYDTFDDPALLEGTASWIEDEVFDSVNDNRQYLELSPIMDRRFTRSGQRIGPFYPLDFFSDRYGSDWAAGWQYGTWIWYRYLSEEYGRRIVREIWQKAVGSRRKGFSAVTAALSARQSKPKLKDVMSEFGFFAAAPEGTFEEGGTLPTAKPLTMPAGAELKLPNGLARRANDYVKLVPESLLPAGTMLTVEPISLPSAVQLGIVSFVSGGDPTFQVVPPSGMTVPFSREDGVSKVVVVVTNSSRSKVGSNATRFTTELS